MLLVQRYPIDKMPRMTSKGAGVRLVTGERQSGKMAIPGNNKTQSGACHDVACETLKISKHLIWKGDRNGIAIKHGCRGEHSKICHISQNICRLPWQGVGRYRWHGEGWCRDPSILQSWSWDSSSQHSWRCRSKRKLLSTRWYRLRLYSLTTVWIKLYLW